MMSVLPIKENKAYETLRTRLSNIDPQLVGLRQAVYSGRRNVEFVFAGTSFVLRFSELDVDQITPVLALQFRAGSAKGWLFLDSFDFASEEWANMFSRLEAKLIHALIAEEARDLFCKLSKATASMVQLTDVQTHPTPPLPAIRQALEIENKTTGVIVRAALCDESPEIFAWLSNELAKLTARRKSPPAAACLPIKIQIGVIWLPVADLSKPQIGDILILPPVGTLNHLNAVCFDDQDRYLKAKVQIKGSTGSLTINKGKTMHRQPNNVKLSNEDEVALDDAQVPITVILGKIELPLHAFGTIESGYVFELPTSVEDAIVRLYTGSACIGQGKLVAVGNRLGVRLLEWGGKSDGTST